VQVSSPPSTAASTSSVPATAVALCAPTDLKVGQSPLSEGAGQYYLAWSLGNAGTASCTLPAVHPTLNLEGQSGQSVQTYSATEQGQTESRPVELAPGAKAWFLTEELATNCAGPQTVTGGPFHYSIGLGADVGTVSWSPSYLDVSRMPYVCTRLTVSIGALQGTKPRP
jgi:hypothetical protein